MRLSRGAALLCLLAVACGGGSGGPTPPTTPNTPTPPPTPQAWSLSGRVLGTVSRTPLAGAQVQAGSLTGTTNGDGRFTLTQPTAPASSLRATISAGGHLTRETSLAWPRTTSEAQLDLISLAAPFSTTLYHQLVRGGLDFDELLPVYRWMRAPRVALHPFDDGGRPLPPEVLATIRATVPRAVEAWSGGLFKNVQLEEVNVADWTEGWIVMHALREQSSDYCGLADWRHRAGDIVMARLEVTLDACACGSRKISPNTVAHELAHALGYWHARGPYLLTDQTGDGCDSFENEVITPAEALHAQIAYSRPPGNRDPDIDPDTFAALERGISLGHLRTSRCR